MAEKYQIRIDSILGGHAISPLFAGEGQFFTSIGIDPSLPPDNKSFSSGSKLQYAASGMIRPVGIQPASGTGVTEMKAAPLWITNSPKTAYAYITCYNGSTFSFRFGSGNQLTVLSDAGELTGGIGNGSEYYDNYIYFAKNTTIARYGPLDQPDVTLDGDYWGTTLGLAALTNTEYPAANEPLNTINYPNHVMHRHSDGRLYIADVVDNQGTLHYIQTTKTNWEGDTDNGSTYSKLNVGYGLWPMAMETYGDSLVISLYEGLTNDGVGIDVPVKNSKLAFWDTNSENINQIVWVEFKNKMITSLKNLNGILYITASDLNFQGFTIYQYIGGNSFKEIKTIQRGTSPFQGAVDGMNNQLFIGSNTDVPEEAACVFSVGLSQNLSGGVFCPIRSGTSEAGNGNPAIVTALSLYPPKQSGYIIPSIIGTSNGGSGSSANRIETTTSSSTGLNFDTVGNAPPIWWSKIYNIGKPFKLTKLTIPLGSAVGANMQVTPKIHFDGGSDSFSLPAINSTNYSGERVITIRPDGAVGQKEFWIEFLWDGSFDVVLSVALPIVIEYELVDEG